MCQQPPCIAHGHQCDSAPHTGPQQRDRPHLSLQCKRLMIRRPVEAGVVGKPLQNDVTRGLGSGRVNEAETRGRLPQGQRALLPHLRIRAVPPGCEQQHGALPRAGAEGGGGHRAQRETVDNTTMAAPAPSALSRLLATGALPKTFTFHASHLYRAYASSPVRSDKVSGWVRLGPLGWFPSRPPLRRACPRPRWDPLLIL